MSFQQFEMENNQNENDFLRKENYQLNELNKKLVEKFELIDSDLMILGHRKASVGS